jgi:UDP-GlcNAc:undecaprenyl-phosphate GlcNAc-1-phosphate transferase
VIAFLFTPIAGRLAQRFGAIDLPAYLRSRREDKETRINPNATLRFGGLSMVVAMFAVLLLNPTIGLNWGIWVGIIVLSVAGIMDDRHDFSPKWQLAAQVIAALMVVLGGIRIESIQVAGLLLDFTTTQVTLDITNNVLLTFYLPADIITVFWIVALINFINWVGGIDGLNGSISSVAAVAMLLIAMRAGNLELAILIAIYLGAVLGVLPFNYHPSKIIYGFGETLNGYLLAIFAILGGSKLAASIIILGLPLLDAIWVAILRMKTRMATTKHPLKILAATMHGDRNHLHHRLLDVGYSWKAVLFIELTMMATLATVAFYFSGFSNDAIQIMIAVSGLLGIFAVVSIARRKVMQGREQRAVEESKKPRVEVKVVERKGKKDDEEDPEKKYAY